ncbi:hypothetical protein VNO77_24604 [Canavalia gladiata]|uniref:Uncharacterized protein n=1 Tax=Canavalia gladiata TaxID=3824 RepID=A0AAN9QA47_CANGL
MLSLASDCFLIRSLYPTNKQVLVLLEEPPFFEAEKGLSLTDLLIYWTTFLPFKMSVMERAACKTSIATMFNCSFERGKKLKGFGTILSYTFGE